MRQNNKHKPSPPPPPPSPKRPAPKTKEEAIRQMAESDPERAAQFIREFLKGR